MRCSDNDVTVANNDMATSMPKINQSECRLGIMTEPNDLI